MIIPYSSLFLLRFNCVSWVNTSQVSKSLLLTSVFWKCFLTFFLTLQFCFLSKSYCFYNVRKHFFPEGNYFLNVLSFYHWFETPETWIFKNFHKPLSYQYSNMHSFNLINITVVTNSMKFTTVTIFKYM